MVWPLGQSGQMSGRWLRRYGSWRPSDPEASSHPPTCQDAGAAILGRMHLPGGKSGAGMADYQARKWSVWRQHMALVSMVGERERYNQGFPLLSCNDVDTPLRNTLPRRGMGHDEVDRQIEKRHRCRQAPIDSAFSKQCALSTGWNGTQSNKVELLARYFLPDVGFVATAARLLGVGA